MKKTDLYVLVAIVWLLSCSLAASAPIDAPVVRLQAIESAQGAVLDRYVLADPTTPGRAVTVTSQAKVVELGDTSSSRQIWLAGVAGKAGERPTLLAITWELDASSWFPVWRLCLRSDAGLLLSPEKTLHLPSMLQPKVGREYNTVFSYDPEAGALSIRVTEKPSGRNVYTGNFSLRKYTGPLYPGAGSQGRIDKQDPSLVVDELLVRPYFVPVGAKARVISRDNADEAWLSVQAADRRDEWAVELSLPDRPLDGEIRLAMDDGVSTSVLRTLLEGTGKQILPIEPQTMPAGKVDFVLEYEAQGVMWEIDRTTVQIGVVDATVESLALADNGEPEVSGVIKVAVDGAMPSFSLTVNGNLSVPRYIRPLHEQWDRVSDIVDLNVATAGETVSIPFSLSLGSMAEEIKGKEVFAEVSVATDLDVPLALSGDSRFVLGDRVPAFPRVKDYVVLRGDFHTHTTLSDGKLVPTERLWESYMHGYDVIALTDHRTAGNPLANSEFAAKLGLVFVPGFETGIQDREHFVVLGADSSYQLRNPHSWSMQPGTSRVFYQDQVREIVAHGGFIVYAHPGGKWVPPGPYEHPEEEYGWTDAAQWMIEQGYIQGIESRGAFAEARRDAPFRWALENGLTLFDVSDIHGPRGFDATNQAPVTLVLAEERTTQGVLGALRAGRTLIWRNGQLRGTSTWLKPFVDSVVEFRMVEREGTPNLEVTNSGALALYGQVLVPGEESSRSILLRPYSSFSFVTRIDVDRVAVRWTNVFSAPNRFLSTEHELKGVN